MTTLSWNPRSILTLVGLFSIGALVATLVVYQLLPGAASAGSDAIAIKTFVGVWHSVDPVDGEPLNPHISNVDGDNVAEVLLDDGYNRTCGSVDARIFGSGTIHPNDADILLVAVTVECLKRDKDPTGVVFNADFEFVLQGKNIMTFSVPGNPLFPTFVAHRVSAD